jgi:Cu2+-exporting ATPase
MFRFSESRSPFPSSSVEPEIATIVSKGIETTIDGAVYRGGKLSFTSPAAVNDPEVIKILASAQSVFTLSRDSQLVAFFGLKDDTIRPEVPGVLQKLRDRGIELFIFSGDRPEAVFPVAKELGIPASNVFGDCYPEDKRARLEILKYRIQDGRATEKADNKVELASSSQATPSSRFRPSGWLRSLSPKFLRNQRKSIVFVGDGTNDAIALMAADIGISLSQSTDMAASSADVAIISDSIVALVGFLDLSERVGLCIRINFAWAIVWNLVAIMGASGAWVDVRIAPEWAGLGEMGSVLPVFLVSWAVGWGYSSGTG